MESCYYKDKLSSEGGSWIVAAGFSSWADTICFSPVSVIIAKTNHNQIVLHTPRILITGQYKIATGDVSLYYRLPEIQSRFFQVL